MVEYNKINTNLSNLQLHKPKSAVKNNQGVILRISVKNFNKDNLPHELRNAINNNMSTDIKFSKAQISKIIKSGGFLRSKLASPLMKVGIALVKNVLAP